MAFTLLVRTGIYPPELRSVNLDVDAIYRRALPSGWSALSEGPTRAQYHVARQLRQRAEGIWNRLSGAIRPEGRLAVPWPTHLTVWWVVLVLGLVLLLDLL